MSFELKTLIRNNYEKGDITFMEEWLDLTMKSFDVEGERILFGFAYDYRANNESISPDVIQRIINKVNARQLSCPIFMCKEFTGSIRENVCYIHMPKQEMVELASIMVGLSYSKDLYTFQVDKVSFQKNTRNTNMSCSSYDLTYLWNDIVLPLSVTCRMGNGINDFRTTYMRKIFRQVVIQDEENGLEKMKSYIRFFKGWKPEESDPDCTELHNCFDYTVCNDHAVILKLKNHLKPEHLLKFDGFLEMYDTYKIEVVGETRFMMYRSYRDEKPFIIQRGNSTTITENRYWNMLDILIDCVAAECGICF